MPSFPIVLSDFFFQRIFYSQFMARKLSENFFVNILYKVFFSCQEQKINPGKKNSALQKCIQIGKSDLRNKLEFCAGIFEKQSNKRL